MSENMSEIPDDWNIQRVAIYDGPSVDFQYEARHWQTRTPPRRYWWSRRSKRITGWFPVYRSRFRYETVDWIRATARAMEQP